MAFVSFTRHASSLLWSWSSASCSRLCYSNIPCSLVEQTRCLRVISVSVLHKEKEGNRQELRIHRRTPSKTIISTAA